MVHLDVEDRAFCLLLAGSLWHKGAYNRTFPCMEANYPYAIKNQRGASKKPLVGGFLRSKAPSRGLWIRGVGSLWHKRHWCSNTMNLSTNESGPHTKNLHQTSLLQLCTPEGVGVVVVSFVSITTW